MTVEAVGLSPDYDAHVRDPGLVAALGSALAPCADGPAVLRIRYAERAGEVRLAGSWRTECRPDGLDLAPVRPIARALAAYRDALAVRYDRRLATFAAAVELDGCPVWLAGQIPPDGTTFGCASDVPCPVTAPAESRLPPERAGCLQSASPGGPTPR